MKVLVTGANGFLGSAVVRHLIKAGYSVRAMIRKNSEVSTLRGLNIERTNGDILDPEAVERAIENCQIVFHLASCYKFYPWWEKEARDIYRLNVEGTKNFLAAALRHKVQRFIFTSSIATIGKNFNGQLSNENTPFNLWSKASHYARSKVLAEQEVIKFSKQGLSCVILNPAILVGERDYKPTPSGEMIVKFLNQAYPCYFKAKMSFADVDDVARAHVLAIKRARVGEKYILCNKKAYTMREVFKLLEEISGIKAPGLKIPYPLLLSFVYIQEVLAYILGKKPLMSSEGVKFCQMSIEYDSSKAVKELDYRATAIEETFKKAVNWYRENGYFKCI